MAGDVIGGSAPQTQNESKSTDQELLDAGFEVESLENFYMESGFKSQSYIYQGVARNPP